MLFSRTLWAMQMHVEFVIEVSGFSTQQENNNSSVCIMAF